MRWLAPALFAAPIGVLAALTLVAVLLTDSAVAGAADEPSEAALHDIPSYALDAYRRAVTSRCPTLSWSVLAAVAKVESDHGRIDGAVITPEGRVEPRVLGPVLDGGSGLAAVPDTDDGVLDGDGVWDRAVGPLQFLPSTWERYEVDGSGDGIADVDHLEDASQTAATYLCEMGAGDPDRLRYALWSYNYDWDYVDDVLEQATAYVEPSLELVSADQVTISAVLSHPELHIYEAGRADIAAGRIDRRILRLLLTLGDRFTIHVSSLQTGHSKCVGGGSYRGCTVSHHWHGRAVDIYKVNDDLVSPRSATAREIVEWLAALDGEPRPDEVGSPWQRFDSIPGFFSDSQHLAHLHIGYGIEP